MSHSHTRPGQRAATRVCAPRLGVRQRQNSTREHTHHEHTTSRGLAAAGLLVTGLAGACPPAPPPRPSAPEWKTERGIVIECQGDAHGVQVWTSVYENQRYGNTVQVVIGDPDDGNGNSRNTDDEVPRRRRREGVASRSTASGPWSRAPPCATAHAPRSTRSTTTPASSSRPAASTASCGPTWSRPYAGKTVPLDLRHRLLLRPRGQEDPDHLSARESRARVAAGDRDVGS